VEVHPIRTESQSVAKNFLALNMFIKFLIRLQKDQYPHFQQFYSYSMIRNTICQNLSEFAIRLPETFDQTSVKCQPFWLSDHVWKTAEITDFSVWCSRYALSHLTKSIAPQHVESKGLG